MIQKVKGTNDILPGGHGEGIFVSERWQSLEEAVSRTAELFVYRELRTPVFEYLELFVHGLGDGSDVVRKEMFSFSDRGERSLALRPEGTAAVVRSFIENNLGGPALVTRLYYGGPMFRAERPQKGRYRQFHQFGIECLGGDGPEYDVEVIAFFWVLLRRLGLGRMVLEINSVGCPACRPAYQQQLREHFRDRLPELCGDCRDRYEKNVLRMLDCKNPACRPLLEDAPAAVDALCAGCGDSWERVRSGLRELDIPFVENRRLVRGLDYYTRTAFEITHDGLGAQATIVGGGRYDLLVAQSGGGDVPAVGGAFGVERLLLALDAESVPLPVRPGPEFFLVLLDPSCEPALVRLLHRLRMAGCAACRSDGSRQVAKQLKAADRSGARRAVFIGGEEWERGEVLVKDLLGGGQTPLPQVDGDPLQALLGLVSGNGHP